MSRQKFGNTFREFFLSRFEYNGSNFEEPCGTFFPMETDKPLSTLWNTTHPSDRSLTSPKKHEGSWHDFYFALALPLFPVLKGPFPSFFEVLGSSISFYSHFLPLDLDCLSKKSPNWYVRWEVTSRSSSNSGSFKRTESISWKRRLASNSKLRVRKYDFYSWHQSHKSGSGGCVFRRPSSLSRDIFQTVFGGSILQGLRLVG